jgi:hypothetical protein
LIWIYEADKLRRWFKGTKVDYIEILPWPALSALEEEERGVITGIGTRVGFGDSV